MPSVSVIILTANRRSLLERTLHALEAGKRTPEQVVVVNNQSTDDTADYLKSASFSFKLTAIDGPTGSFAECRNAGVEAAESDLIAFLDDDCEADRFWLARMVEAIEANQWAAAGGAVIPADALPSPEWYSPDLAWTIGCSTPAFFTPLAGRQELPTTSNLVYRRELAEEFPFRGLSESKGALAWNYEFSREDSQFWRELRRAGKPVGAVPDAIVWHHVPFDRLDKDRMRERARQDGRGFWRRERIREEVGPAVRDVVFTPIAALEDAATHSVPLGQAWEARRAWSRRQLAFLGYAIDDHNYGVSPQSRLASYLVESGRAAASIAKMASRHVAQSGYSAFRRLDPLPTIENPPKRLLVVLHDLLGDAVLSLPMLKQLETGFPEADIFVMTGPSAGPILRENAPEAFEIIELPPEARGRGPSATFRLHEFLRQYLPDAVLLAYCHGLAPAPLFFLGEAPVVGWPEDNGLEQKTYAGLLAHPVNKAFHKPETVALLDLLAPFAIPTEVERPRLQPSEKARTKREAILKKADAKRGEYAFLHVDAPTRAKHWPVERFFEVADHLHQRGLAVFMEGSAAGRRATEAGRTERPWCHSLHGLLDTDELAAMIEGARVFAGCDSGPSHTAQAVATPGVFLFGASETKRWGPLPRLAGEKQLPPWKILSAAPGDWLAEEARGLAFNHGLGLLSAKMVCKAVDEILEGGENFPSPPERH